MAIELDHIILAVNDRAGSIGFYTSIVGLARDREPFSVLRGAVAGGVDHIETSDFYGPHVTNQLIREALHPYPDKLVMVTKLGAVRGADAYWIPALTPANLIRGVHNNLGNCASTHSTSSTYALVAPTGQVRVRSRSSSRCSPIRSDRA